MRVMVWFSSISVFWAEITLKSLLSALILSRASTILSRGKDCEVPKLVGKWSEFGSKFRFEFRSEFRSELELELEGGPVDFLVVVVSEDSISVGGFEPGGITRQGEG